MNGWMLERKFIFAPFMKILFAKTFNIIKGGGIVLWRSAFLDVRTFEI